MEFVWNKFQIILIRMKQWSKSYGRIHWRRVNVRRLRVKIAAASEKQKKKKMESKAVPSAPKFLAIPNTFIKRFDFLVRFPAVLCAVFRKFLNALLNTTI